MTKKSDMETALLFLSAEVCLVLGTAGFVLIWLWVRRIRRPRV